MLTELSAAVAEQKTVYQSVVTLLNNIADRVAGVSPEKSAIDALAADIRANTASIAEAAKAHTVAEDEPTA